MRKVKAARRQTGQVRTKAKKPYVDVTEEIIMNPDALPTTCADGVANTGIARRTFEGPLPHTGPLRGTASRGSNRS